MIKIFVLTASIIVVPSSLYANEWVGKNLLNCSKSFGTTVTNFTECKFGPAIFQEKTDYSLKYTVTYTYQCNGARLNFGVGFGEGSGAVFQRMENGSSKQEMIFEGKGPLQTLDNKPSSTKGALFAGLCEITVDSLSIGLTSDSQELFSDYSDLIVQIGSSNSQLKLIDSNTALLSTLIARVDLESLGPMIRNIRDNVKTMIEAREAIEEKSDGVKEVIKSLKLVLLDIEGEICQNPALKEGNADVCNVDPVPTPSEGKTISEVLAELQTTSGDLLKANTEIVTSIVGKVWNMTSPLSDPNRATLRERICENLSKAKLSSIECQH